MWAWESGESINKINVNKKSPPLVQDEKEGVGYKEQT